MIYEPFHRIDFRSQQEYITFESSILPPTGLPRGGFFFSAARRTTSYPYIIKSPRYCIWLFLLCIFYSCLKFREECLIYEMAGAESITVVDNQINQRFGQLALHTSSTY
jgi:hypothetical protein